MEFVPQMLVIIGTYLGNWYDSYSINSIMELVDR